MPVDAGSSALLNAKAKANASDGIRLDRLTVMLGRMRLEVSLAHWVSPTTNEAIAEQVIARYPTICAHSCINSSGPTFGDVIGETSVAHLLEHMIIEEQLADALRAVDERVGSFEASVASEPSAPDDGVDVVDGIDCRSARAEAAIVGGLSLVGTTRVRDGGRKAIVEVSFFDDLVAAKAIGLALAELNSMLPCKPYLC